MDRVPVANIYFLLCYAWNHLQEAEYADVRTEGCDKIWDLLARVVARGSQQLIKRGLHRDYVLHRERRTRLRGKIMMAEELRRPSCGMLSRVCEFDELDSDVLPNQIIHATIRTLLRHPSLAAEITRELNEVAPQWSSFSIPVMTRQTFRRVRISRSMRHYRFVMNVCELIHQNRLPTAQRGESRFRDFLQDEAQMGTIFEQFVRNFFAREQSDYAVSAPQVEWDVDSARSTDGGLRLLPSMKTDIVLQSGDDRLIIDCKFYRDAFQRHHDTAKFISGHLYQLFTYLTNQSVQPGWKNVRAMLLYPTVDEPVDERVYLNGRELRVASINLGQDWQQISADLLRLLRPAAVASVGNPA